MVRFSFDWPQDLIKDFVLMFKQLKICKDYDSSYKTIKEIINKILDTRNKTLGVLYEKLAYILEFEFPEFKITKMDYAGLTILDGIEREKVYPIIIEDNLKIIDTDIYLPIIIFLNAGLTEDNLKRLEKVMKTYLKF